MAKPVDSTSPRATTIPRVAIPSTALPLHQRLCVHRKTICLTCDSNAIEASHQEDEARLLSWRLDNIVLTHSCDRGLTLGFKADHTARTRDGLIRLIQVLAPAKTADRLRLHNSLEPLDSTAIHLVGMAQEIITCVGGQSMAFIPYSAVGYNPARHPPHLRFDLDSPAGSILGPVVTTLRSELDDLPENEAPAVAAGLTGLVRGLIAALPTRSRTQQTPADARRAAIISYIEQNLSDPDLGIARIEATLGTARSTMFRDFERHGGVEHYIKRRRLEQAFVVLAHREHTDSSIADLSRRLGFSSRNHFSRVFNAEFGCRPRDVRCRAAIPEVDSGHVNGRSAEAAAKLATIASWLSDIRRH